ncbi:collagen-binding domain-containing protein [Polymorphobacter fuscus]|uniref:collagen-binding domain-containing protein n=1 Tax=Sandarakinorhabdus fusca TaxID=1439888 RepID=UPI00143030E5|nr:collagen-binding domain-containing protein [Polymorphobacter fuscus]NJC08571.1 choice-of-anchor A domain-containing protein [Polymorphobacter fuscus]
MTAGPAAAAGNASAGLQAMRELNLIVLGDMKAGHETEGKAFIGGNVTGSTSNFGIGNASQGAAVSTRRTLTVGGDVGPTMNINQGSNGGNGNVATSPGILIGGNYAGGNFNVAGAAIDIGGNFSSGNVNLTNGQTVNVGGNITANANGNNNSQTVNAGGSINGNANGAVFNANKGAGWNAATTSLAVAAERVQLQSDLQALSSTLSGLANTSNVTSSGANNPVIHAVDGGQGYAVLNLTSAFFTDYAGQLSYDLPSTSLPLIVNVAGTGAFTWGLNPAGGNKAYNQSVIWNFYEASSINFTTMFNGSVLAPYATISNNTPIEGSVAVLGFNQGGEVHLGTYALGESFLTSTTPGTVPEPTVWAMLIGGFGLVGAAMRKRRAAIA